MFTKSRSVFMPKCFAPSFLLVILLIFLMPASVASAQDICDSYEHYFDNFGFGQEHNLAQTFTPNTNHGIDYVELVMSVNSFNDTLCNPGLVTVEIQSTDSENKPSGDVLSRGSFDGTSILSGNSQVVYVNLNRCVELSAETTYAIVVSAPDASFAFGVRLWNK